MATGGSGRFKPMIQWMTWGDPNDRIQPGSTLTKSVDTVIAGQTLRTTCTISNIRGDVLHPYKSGTWRADGFDNLYNIGGTDGANQLVAGLANVNNTGTTVFDFNCSATLSGQPFDLTGLVMADAESSSVEEHVGATPVPSGTDPVTWRIIDRVRGPQCTVEATAWRSATTNRLELYGSPADTCEAAGATNLWPAPSAVAFMENATSAKDVIVKGRGYSAIALGVALQVDFGDAPASYGAASSALQYNFTGGTVNAATGLPPSQGGTDRGQPLFSNFNLANIAQPTQRLGNTVDPEVTSPVSADARGDDITGDPLFGPNADEDALSLGQPAGTPTTLVLKPGATYTLAQNVPFQGAGKVAAWLDLNANGTFEAGEQSNTLTTSGGRLTWTVPSTLPPGTTTTILRLRMVGPTDTLAPTGLSLAGEVEDYQVRIASAPKLTVVKQVNGRSDASDQFTISATGPAMQPGTYTATTTGTNTSATIPATYLNENASFSISDQMAPGSASPLSDYDATISCVDRANGNAAVSMTAGAAGSWTRAAGLLPNQDVVCTVTNTQRPDALDVSKSYVSTSGPTASGDYTARYQVTVANTGRATTYGSLVDTPQFSPELVVNGASWTATASAGQAPAAGSGNGAGPFTLTGAGTPIARNATHTYTVDVTFHYRGTAGAAPCSGTGTGLYNAASLPAGQEAGPSGNNSACSAPPAVPTRSLGLVKEISGLIVDTNGNNRDDVGDVVNYKFTVTNNSQVTLTGIKVDDPLIGAVTCVATTLAPGASTTCTGSYSLKQGDVDAGRVVNNAKATGTGPVGDTVTSNTATATVLLTPKPLLTLDKVVDHIDDVDGSGLVDAGDRIHYRFTVTNTGNVTLDPVRITDPKLTGLTCTPTRLGPGGVATCTANPYVITTADETAEEVVNTATAHGTPPTGADVTATDSTTTEVGTPAPAIDLKKTVAGIADTNGSGLTDAGDEITYTFTVTNTGNVPLSQVQVNDPLLGAVTCTPTSLGLGGVATCTADPYVIKQSDQGGNVVNTATATGKPPSGPNVTDTDSTSTRVDTPAPSIELDKSVSAIDDVDGSGVTDAGDEITYSFTVTNTGNVPLSSVRVDDPKLTNVVCTPTTLAPGAVANCTADPYVVTAADEAAGTVVNTATAHGTPPAGPGVPAEVTDTDTTTTPIDTPSIALDKQVASIEDTNDSGLVDAG
ncbi:CshA/CshB family fibrillar adhesin-related protein, partial [Nocardioides sp. GXZ039]|uniref:CshA/CshB family fibrillar adhesin-related protein n=1 Tax=Nocardioides sp. GXZ039 TaxID=3136018 RepID=UPI0030F3D97A